MQITSINKTNFGMNFSNNINELLDNSCNREGSYFSKQLKEAKETMNDWFDDSYTMGIKALKGGGQAIVLKPKKGIPHQLLCLDSNTLLDVLSLDLLMKSLEATKNIIETINK